MSRNTVKIVTEELEHFLSLIESRKFLYDPTNKLYFNRDAKKLAWDEISKASNLTAKEAKTKYTSLRGAYSKSKKCLPSGSGRSKKSAVVVKQEAEFMQRMSFLDSFLQSRKTSGNYEGSDEDNEVEGDKNTTCCQDESEIRTVQISSEDSCDDDSLQCSKFQETPTNSQVSGKCRDNSRKRRKVPTKPTDMERLFNILEKSDDEEEIFAKSVAATLKGFDANRKALAKFKIQQVLFEVTVNDTTQ